MNKIEKHLLKAGAFDDLDKCPVSEHSDEYTMIVILLRRAQRVPSFEDEPYCYSRLPHNGQQIRCLKLWVDALYWAGFGVDRNYWTGHYKPSVLALWLLSNLVNNDPQREGSAETNWTCDDEGHPLQGRRDSIEYLIVRGWLKRSHPFLDLTDAGIQRAAEYAQTPEGRMPRCTCGLPVQQQDEALCPTCYEEYARFYTRAEAPPDYEEDDYRGNRTCYLCGEYEPDCGCDPDEDYYGGPGDE